MSKVIVIGAGFSGGAAALMLAADGHEVVVVDRDAGPVPAGPDEAWNWDRRSIRQYRFAHGLLPRGYRLMAKYFPQSSSSGCESTADSRSIWPTRSSISSPDRPIDPTTTVSARSRPAGRRSTGSGRARWPMNRRSRCVVARPSWGCCAASMSNRAWPTRACAWPAGPSSAPTSSSTRAGVAHPLPSCSWTSVRRGRRPTSTTAGSPTRAATTAHGTARPGESHRRGAGARSPRPAAGRRGVRPAGRELPGATQGMPADPRRPRERPHPPTSSQPVSDAERTFLAEVLAEVGLLTPAGVSR